jgi:DNA-binding transcriptional MerR regulator
MKYAHFSLADIKAVIASLGQEVSGECAKKNLAIFTGKREELLETIKNYQGIIKLFDDLFPLMNSDKTYIENEEKVAAFVQDIYKQVCGKEVKS